MEGEDDMCVVSMVGLGHLEEFDHIYFFILNSVDEKFDFSA